MTAALNGAVKVTLADADLEQAFVRDTESGVAALSLAICAAGELWGGVEECIVTLADGLRRHGLTPTVVLFYQGRLAEVMQDRGFPVEVLPSRHPYDPSHVSSLKDVFRRRRINVVHAHGYKATVTTALAKGRTVKVIKTEHGRLEAPSGWRGVPGYLRLGANVALDVVASRAGIDRMVYVSEDIRRVRAPWCGAGVVIHNGLTPAARPWRSKHRRADGSSFTLGIVGRLSAVKGHAYLFRALAGLPAAITLKVFGTGPDELALRQLAATLGISGRVEFAGFVSPIEPHLAALDLLVMPSLHEGLPYTLLEAMSAGVPVVASRVGGLVEAIEDGVSGCLVPAQDPKALARAIHKLYAEPELADAISTNARARVESAFHADRMVQRYLDAYLPLAR